jgi:hypothetical protein
MRYTSLLGKVDVSRTSHYPGSRGLVIQQRAGAIYFERLSGHEGGQVVVLYHSTGIIWTTYTVALGCCKQRYSAEAVTPATRRDVTVF